MAEKKNTVKITLCKRRSSAAHEASEEFFYEIPHAIETEEVVDMDSFQPINEALKKLEGKRELTGDEVEMYYDFASGTDNHGEIPYNRSAENLDIAMLSEHIKKSQNEMKKEISKANEELKIRTETEQTFTQNGQE